MLKASSILRGLVAAGLIAATPAIAQSMMEPTQTRASSSLLTFTGFMSQESTTMMTTSTPNRQSPLLVPEDSPG
jgi:hypothetical protein